MARQTILWTAVPNGFAPATGRARVSVHVSPRLTANADGILAPFDFLDWPARLAAGKFECALQFGNTTVNAVVVSTPDSRRWQSLFDARTFVRSHEVESLPRTYGTYPVASLHDELKRSYQEVCATSPLDRSSRKVITAAFAELHAVTTPSPSPGPGTVTTMSAMDARIQIARSLLEPDVSGTRAARLDDLVDRAQGATLTPAQFTAIVPDTGAPADPFIKLAAFHAQPRGRAVRNAVASNTLGPHDTRMDFHQQLTLLGEYPAILRLLGIVIDVEIDAGLVPEASSAAPGRVRVVPRLVTPLSMDTEHLTPQTAYVSKRGKVFAAASRVPDAETIDGFLNLRQNVTPGSKEQVFRIVQVDVDSAGLRAIDLVGKAGQKPAEDVPGDGDTLALPPIRTAGISIVREGHAESLLGAVSASSAALDSGNDATLFSEDLTRGYRIDVRDGSAPTWRSLHERVGRYDFPSLPAMELADEGSIQPAITRPSSATEGVSASLDTTVPSYIPESLFLWQGWSLAARRPGSSLPLPPDEGPSRTAPDPAATLKLGTRFRPPRGSLPRLRFGQQYELRARVVDVAGNSLSLDEANAIATAPTLPSGDDRFVFRRFEPVAAPLLVLRSAMRDGDTLERIVIRSAPEVTAEAFTAAHPEFANSAERHITPPRTWQLMAEMHGQFDSAIGLGNASAAHSMRQLASRESAEVHDVHPEAALSVRYLPDPLAAGASFRGLPGIPDGKVARLRDGRLELTDLPLSETDGRELGSLALIDFGAASLWPDQLPFRLRLIEGQGAPTWSPAERVLAVAIPKGETRTVRIACHLRDDSELKLLGIWQWMVEFLGKERDEGRISKAEFDSRLEEFRQRSLLGLWWMQTPYRELTLVHAVQQPLAAPIIDSFAEPLKRAGRTFVYLQGQVTVHPGSTGKLDLVARWNDRVDEREVPCEAVVFETLLPSPSTKTVTYAMPPIEALEASVQDGIHQVTARGGELRSAVLAMQRPHPDLRTFAATIQSQCSALLGLAAEASWHTLAAAAAKIQAVSGLDDLLQPNAPNPVKEVSLRVTLATEDMDKAARAVETTALNAIATLERWPRHELGDTKHRKVRYQAVGTTRFREYFLAGEPDRPQPADTFTRSSDPVEVHVLSTARPAAPKVRYVIPLFVWETTKDAASGELVRRRRGGGLRVFLERPWFSSGEGELLGVIVADAGSAPTEQQRQHVTQCARDPIWKSGPAPDALTLDRFALRTEAMSSLTVPELPGMRLGVAGHEVHFEKERELWSCDLEIDAGASYFPFVRLALARFQPHSREGMHLSQIVSADWVQLVPARTVTLSPIAASRDRFDLRVDGLTYFANAWHPGDESGDPNAGDLVPLSGEAPPYNVARSLIEVSVERRMPGTNDAAGWMPASAETGFRIDGESVKAGASTAPETPLWSGRVTLPADRAPGDFRVVVREREHFLTDETQIRVFEEKFPEPPRDAPPGKTPLPQRISRRYFPGVGRLVFADAIEL